MAMLEIDGIGKVEIEDGFLALSPEKQAAEVDAIAATLKPAPLAAPAAPAGDEIVKRGSILPVGRTAAGDIVPALPEFAENARQTIKDLMDGKKTADQISGRDMFDIMGVLGLIPGTTGMAAAGTGAGVARVAAQRAAPVAERAAVATEAPSAATAAAEQVLKPNVSPVPVEAPVPPPVAAAEPVIAAPTTAAEIKAAAKSYYKQAEDAGVIIGAPKIKSLAEDVIKATVEAGIDPTLHPRSSAALKRIADIAEDPITFERLEIIRRVANAAGKGLDKDEGRIAGIIKDKIDDMIGSLKPEDLISGNAKAAAESITKARELWTKVAKLDKVDEMVDRAQSSAAGFSGSGFENALRTEFRSLAKNPGQMRGFTAEEQAAIKKVARGGFKENAARGVGKLAPTGVVSGALSGGIGAAVGTALGIGPVAGAATATSLGFAGRRLATVLTKRNVAALEKLIASGGNSEMATASLQRSRALLAALEGGIKAAKTGSGSGKAGPTAAVQGDQRRK